MGRFSEVAIDIINDLHVKCIDYDTKYTPLINAVNKLQETEETNILADKLDKTIKKADTKKI